MTPQEQAFTNWYDNQPTFGVDYQEIWDAACAWQREQDAKICKSIGDEYFEESSDDFGFGCYACSLAIEKEEQK